VIASGPSLADVLDALRAGNFPAAMKVGCSLMPRRAAERA
jgi:hypothetical protein